MFELLCVLKISSINYINQKYLLHLRFNQNIKSKFENHALGNSPLMIDPNGANLRGFYESAEGLGVQSSGVQRLENILL